MSGDLFLKFLMILILSGVLAWCIFSRYDEEIGSESGDSRRQRYLPYLNGMVLPILPLSLFCVFAIFYGSAEAIRTIVPICFGIFLQISIYYALLAPSLPLLRKHISARVCALLWLLPNYTYLVYCNSIMASGRPRIILHIPGKFTEILLYVWLAGFIFVIVHSFIQHFSFRKKILSAAEYVTDPEVLDLWKKELEDARVRKPKYKLLVSNNIFTPLSIGFFNKSICVILPRRSYTQEELSLIFRHEIVHICRGDSSNKFSMVFCCAMCWFNPLMWLAMRKSADDLELSCDETVLINADDATKKLYANLILNTASDERGFTTCLSASPAALRYRLKNIVRKEGKRSGGLIAALICFLLFISFGNVAISCGDFTGQEVIFTNNGIESLSDIEIFGINTSFDYGNSLISCTDEAALMQYLSGLELSRINGNYTLEQYDNELELFCRNQHLDFDIHLSDQVLEIINFNEYRNPLTFYEVRNEIDWEYLFSLFAPRSIQDPDKTFPPEMMFHPEAYTTYYHTGIIRELTVNGKIEEQDVYFAPVCVIEVQDPAVHTIEFNFSHQPSLPFYIEITNQSGEHLENITYEEQASRYPLPVIDDAHYQCFVTFQDENSILNMEYPFDMCYFTE